MVFGEAKQTAGWEMSKARSSNGPLHPIWPDVKLPYQIFCVELTFLYFKIGPVILVPHVGVLCLDCSIENNETSNVEH